MYEQTLYTRVSIMLLHGDTELGPSVLLARDPSVPIVVPYTLNVSHVWGK